MGCNSCRNKVPLTQGQLVVNLAKSLTKWIAGGLKVVDSREHAKRLSICEQCEFYKDFRCTLCGCIMYIKSKLATSYCPHKEKFWGPGDLKKDSGE